MTPDVLVLATTSSTAPAGWTERFGAAVETALADARTTKTAQTLALALADGPRRLVVVAVETADDTGAPTPPGEPVPPPVVGRAEAWRWAGARAAGAVRAVKAQTVTVELPPHAADAEALAEGFGLGSYRYTRYRTAPQDPAPEVTFAGDADVSRARILADSTALARDLVNRSPDEKLAPEMADLFASAAHEAGVEAEVWDEARLADEGFGGLLGVARGSMDPPRFVILRHMPAGADGPPVVLVGKTIVFDTGGLSLKPTLDSMDKMKADMAGGAAVVGAVVAAARLGIAVPVVALLPITDNRPGERAYVPGDVLRMHSGATVEVLNTDAEGRLVLADALSYARSLQPRLVVDVATLTGAQGTALGERVAAVVTRPGRGALARWVTTLGEATGDLAWPMPLYGHYREQLKSDVADLKNVGGSMAGVITAAAFLDHFTRDASGEPAYDWLHLDIARPSFLSAPYGYRPKGASGFGVRLLVALLQEVADGKMPV